MRVFSNRDRSAVAGPLPVERLPRLATGHRTRPAPPLPPLLTGPVPGPASFVPSIDAIRRVLVDHRHAELAPGPAFTMSAAAAVDNIRGYCYFLDADIVGVGRLPRPLRDGDPCAGHDSTVVIAVGHQRPARPDEPGHHWIEGGEGAGAGSPTPSSPPGSPSPR